MTSFQAAAPPSLGEVIDLLAQCARSKRITGRPLALFAALVCAGGVHAGPLEVEVVEGAKPPVIERALLDLSGYSVQAIRERIGVRTGGRARLSATEGESLMSEATRRERGDDLRQRQATGDLRMIVIEGGPMTLRAVVDALASEDAASSDGDSVTIRLPVLVRPGATLIIDGKETPRVRLSTDRGAFLINGGVLYVIDSEVIAWDEAADAPTGFVEKGRFRPYVASMIRSETYLAGSRFCDLGHAAPTAYGVSLSTQPERIHGEPTDAAPTGVLVGNVFEGLYYGFYSYEARDVALVDNLYRDSVVYGIDPHDRSTRLLIARNTTTGTTERHGIIGSRGVSDSLIVQNKSYGNAGSGIMLDRDCRDVLIAGNQVFRNGQGIAIYESTGATVIDNLVAGNSSSGLRVRNSVEVVAARNTLIAHGDYAIDVAAKRLTDHDKREARGDYYTQAVRLDLFATKVQANRGFAKGNGLGVLRIGGIDVGGLLENASDALGGIAIEGPYQGRDREFGGELKSVRQRLEPAFLPMAPRVEVRGDSNRRSAASEK